VGQLKLCSFKYTPHKNRSRESSVSVVSDYWLDDRAIGVWSPARAKDFSSNLWVQTGSEAHPASCTMGTGSPFPGAKRGRGVTLTTHPHLVPRSRMSTSYILSPQASTWRVARQLCFFCLTWRSMKIKRSCCLFLQSWSLSAMRMGGIRSSESVVITDEITGRHKPQYHTLHSLFTAVRASHLREYKMNSPLPP
jgi:hypothetical protein